MNLMPRWLKSMKIILTEKAQRQFLALSLELRVLPQITSPSRFHISAIFDFFSIANLSPYLDTPQDLLNRKNQILRKSETDFGEVICGRTLKKKTRKQFSYLLQDYRHPSLNAKKYHDASDELWQARIDRGYRFYFFVQNPQYIVVSIIHHPK